MTSRFTRPSVLLSIKMKEIDAIKDVRKQENTFSEATSKSTLTMAKQNQPPAAGGGGGGGGLLSNGGGGGSGDGDRTRGLRRGAQSEPRLWDGAGNGLWRCESAEATAETWI